MDGVRGVMFGWLSTARRSLLPVLALLPPSSTKGFLPWWMEGGHGGGSGALATPVYSAWQIGIFPASFSPLSSLVSLAHACVSILCSLSRARTHSPEVAASQQRLPVFLSTSGHDTEMSDRSTTIACKAVAGCARVKAMGTTVDSSGQRCVGHWHSVSCPVGRVVAASVVHGGGHRVKRGGTWGGALRVWCPTRKSGAHLATCSVWLAGPFRHVRARGGDNR